MERGGPEAPIDDELAHVHPDSLRPTPHSMKDIAGHGLESPPVPIEYAGGSANTPTPSSELSAPAGPVEGLSN